MADDHKCRMCGASFSSNSSGGTISLTQGNQLSGSVTLSTFDLEFDSVVYSAVDYDLPRNLLGREGWLQKICLTVIDYDAEIYLSPYNGSA